MLFGESTLVDQNLLRFWLGNRIYPDERLIFFRGCNSRRKLISFILIMIRTERDESLMGLSRLNRPFPSCFKPHYESEAKCKVFVMKIRFHSYANKTNFHMKSFALSLAFIVRFTATRKWPINLMVFSPNP